MGTGKSAVGPLAAAALGYTFVDLDHCIEAAAGKPIKHIFADEGEDAFRDMESEALVRLSQANHQVISTGGGCVIREANRTHMSRTGHVICLTASAACIVRRTGRGRGKRPLLANSPDPMAHVSSMLLARAPYYNQCHHIVDSTGRTVEAVAADVVRLHQEAEWKS